MTSDPLADRLVELRADTPGTATVAHLNNAGSALPSALVTDTVVAYLRREEQIGGYEALWEVEPKVADTRDSIGRLINCHGNSISLLNSATEAWDRAFSALVHSNQLRAGDQVLVATSEYASNVIPILQIQKSIGVELVFVPDGPDGSLDVAALADLVNERTALVALTHAPSQNGLINDMQGVGQALRDANSRAWFLIDACQSVGQIEVDVQAIGCDFLSVTGRKFLRGPRGTGFLYSSQRALSELEPFPLDLNAADWSSTGAAGDTYKTVANAIRFESWEKSYANVLGLGAAVDYALGLGMPAIEARIGTVANHLRQQLAEIAGVTVNDRGTRKGGIVTFMKSGVEASEIVTALRAAKVNCSLSNPDYAMRDFATYGITSQVRLSPHVYTSPEEISLAAQVVAAL